MPHVLNALEEVEDKDCKIAFYSARTLNGSLKFMYFDEQALTDGSTIDWNLQTQQVAKLTLTGTNRTLNAATNHVAGLVCVLSIIQDGTGS